MRRSTCSTGKRIVQRVIDWAQIRIDLFLHIAGQKAQPFARLDRRARQDQPVNRAGNQHSDGLRDRQIGFAGARRAQARR